MQTATMPWGGIVFIMNTTPDEISLSIFRGSGLGCTEGWGVEDAEGALAVGRGEGGGAEGGARGFGERGGDL